MKRPLLAVAILYVGGVLLADGVSVSLALLFTLSLLVGVAAWLQSRTNPWLLGLLLVLAGWTNHAWRKAVISPFDLRNTLGNAAEIATVRGHLAETPRQHLVAQSSEPAIHSLAEVRVEAIRRKGEWQPAYGTLITSTPVELPAAYFRGRHVEVTGVLEAPRGPAADGLFDYRAYLARRGVYFQFRTEGQADWQLLDARESLKPPLEERFSAWAQESLLHGLPEEDGTLHLMWALALGWRTGLTSEVAEPYMRSGTMHLFAISGLHVVLISGILVQLFRFLSMSRTAAGLTSIPLLWFYCAATGWQSSASRAAVMATVVLAGWALRRPSDLLNSLGAAAFLILLWEPRELFQAGFQLSFVVVLGLALMGPYFDSVRRWILAPDPMLPPELRPKWQQRLDAPVSFVLAGFGASFASWLASLPMIAGYFHLLTPVSLLANLVLVPLSDLALMSCLGSVTCRVWLPYFTTLFNHSAWLWMFLMNWFSEKFAAMPFAFSYVSAPDGWLTAGWYALLLAVLGRELLGQKSRIVMVVLAVACGAAHLVASAPTRGEVQLVALATGRGECFYIHDGARGTDVVIDASVESGADHVVKPYLRSRGLDRLTALILTHGDVNHVGGTDLLRREFRCGEIITSDASFRSPEYRRIVAGLEKDPRSWRKVHRGDACEGWTVLSPVSEDKFTQADDKALVLRGEFHGVRVLFVSDLGKLGQRALLEREKDLRADVLIGGTTTNDDILSDTLIDAVQPRAIIVNAPRIPAAERPSAALRQRLAVKGVPVYYTLDDASVTLTIRRDGHWQIVSTIGTKQTSGVAAKY